MCGDTLKLVKQILYLGNVHFRTTAGARIADSSAVEERIDAYFDIPLVLLEQGNRGILTAWVGEERAIAEQRSKEKVDLASTNVVCKRGKEQQWFALKENRGDWMEGHTSHW